MTGSSRKNGYRQIKRRLRMLPVVACCVLLSCSNQRDDHRVGHSKSFRIENLVKGDVDMVAEIHLELSLAHLEQLAEKLYRRNPNQWRKAGHQSLQDALQQVFAEDRPYALAALGHRRSIDAIGMAFEQDFQGDRVLAFVEGVRTMLLDAYGGRRSFNLVHSFDPQQLYLAARNIEIAVWKLSNDRDIDGNLFLLSNAANAPVANLSFERQFGKLIAWQDAMAHIIADSTNRRIKNVIQHVASAVFFPI